jgi:hypothetical protein
VNSGFIAKLDLASCLDEESVTQKGNFCRTPAYQYTAQSESAITERLHE